MIDNVPSLVNLLKNLHQVPYLASKNLYRVANFLLSMEEEKLEQFCKAILDAKQHVTQCTICFTWKEHEGACSFCASSKRDETIICVVQTWQDLISIEKTGGYNGLYHVLCGAICPLEGIGPEDLKISELLQRVQESAVKEVILATNQTPEGEATAAFIAQKIKKFAIKVSCLSRGVPVGGSLEFMDRLTVYKALSERRPF